MSPQDLALVRESVGVHRRIIEYFPQRYARDLLIGCLDYYPTIRELRQSPFAGLLERPLIKPLLAQCGTGRIAESLLTTLYHDPLPACSLSLGSWGNGDTHWRWNQMSRPGYNLTLLLNLDRSSEQRFRRQTKADSMPCWRGHPHDNKRSTIAWARLDIDLEHQEVLIEEMQSDFVRLMSKRYLRQRHGEEAWHLAGACMTASQEACQQAFDSFAAIKKYWSECMLWATLRFISDELGISRVFYHSFKGGTILKHIPYKQPPRSLYTMLPKRFGFHTTDVWPLALISKRRAKTKHMPEQAFFFMDVPARGLALWPR